MQIHLRSSENKKTHNIPSKIKKSRVPILWETKSFIFIKLVSQSEQDNSR